MARRYDFVDQFIRIENLSKRKFEDQVIIFFELSEERWFVAEVFVEIPSINVYKIKQEKVNLSKIKTDKPIQNQIKCSRPSSYSIHEKDTFLEKLQRLVLRNIDLTKEDLDVIKQLYSMYVGLGLVRRGLLIDDIKFSKPDYESEAEIPLLYPQNKIVLDKILTKKKRIRKAS